MISKIGAGSFGDVYKAVKIKKEGDSSPDEYFAIKRVRCINVRTTSTELNIIKMMEEHPNFPKLYGAQRYKSTLSIIMSYFDGAKFEDFYKVFFYNFPHC